MSLHRVILVAVATVFSVGMTSMASACCDFGYSTPVAYAAMTPVAYGGCGGGCAGPVAPVAPVAAAPIGVTVAVTPFGGPCCSWNGCGDCGWRAWNGWNDWGGGWGWGRGCGCGGCGGCARAVGSGAPLYVVNQGPVYSGPGIMIPYQTYSPDTAYAPAADYPYVPGYGTPPVAGYGYNPGYGYGPTPAYPPLYHGLYVRRHYVHAAPRWRHYP